MNNSRSASFRVIRIVLLLAMLAASAAAYVLTRHGSAPVPAPVPSAPPQGAAGADLAGQFAEILASYRKVIVLLAHEDGLPASERDAANRAGQSLFHDNLARIDAVSAELEKVVLSNDPARFDTLHALLDYVESGQGLYDADRLAFREVLQSMQVAVAKGGSLPAIKLHKRIGEDLGALDEIERMYEKEIAKVFGRFEQRAIQLKRERWDDYVAHLEKLYPREQILKENGVILPYAAVPGSVEEAQAKAAVISGPELPPKTLVLSFDDGPHPVYSLEIEAILKQYDVPAVFFNVGRNLGTVAADGKAAISERGEVSRKLRQDGFVLGNHSYTHAQLSKVTGKVLQAEINDTDALLKGVDADRAPLFRFPYGASSAEGEKLLQAAHLKSVKWNIDSMDWADPVPASIADRVLQQVNKEGRGIILFHDIHERAVKALPAVLDRLVADGYQFAGWDGSIFRVTKTASAGPERMPVTSGYGESWGIVIGIDSYAKWPQLHYAASDAQAVRETLVRRFGFAADHVISLQNAEATRAAILSAFHDRLVANGTGKDDRVFVFFAGHGATRKLSSGRDLGYIVPVDSDPGRFETDAIPMTEIQDIAESLTAKHVLFVMDACYSGLGLARGAASASYLRDNAKRIGRQMLTAGGADQMVADGGPGGHSVFTWTLLQGLEGKGDLNGDGLITATELAAYTAPAVSGMSQQTPAFGSLPGSQGGDFVFEARGENEFINEQTAQLGSDAIALNSKLDAASPQPLAHDAGTPAPKAAPVVVKDLQGADRKIAVPVPALVSVRQMAQSANDRGLQLYREKKYGEAEDAFTEALKLRPDFALAANNLGFVFYKQGKSKEAAAWFENTIRMDPSRAIAYLNLGDAYAQANDREKARKAFQTYLDLVPSGGRAAYARQQVANL